MLDALGPAQLINDLPSDIVASHTGRVLNLLDSFGLPTK